MGDAGVDAGLAQFDAATIDLLEMPQIIQEDTIAAADIEDPAAGFHHIGDQLQIDADALGSTMFGFRQGHYFIPWCSAQPLRKPGMTAKNAGSSSRNAPCPVSDSISTEPRLTEGALS